MDAVNNYINIGRYKHNLITELPWLFVNNISNKNNSVYLALFYIKMPKCFQDKCLFFFKREAALCVRGQYTLSKYNECRNCRIITFPAWNILFRTWIGKFIHRLAGVFTGN